MKHSVLYKKEGLYTGWPLPALLPDGRLTVVVQVSHLVEHFALGERITLVSDDHGETWSESDDPSIPSNWPGSSTRERHDRYEAILPGGRYLAAGGVGWEVWPASDRAKADEMGLAVFDGPDPATDDLIVGGYRLSRAVVGRSRTLVAAPRVDGSGGGPLPVVSALGASGRRDRPGAGLRPGLVQGPAHRHRQRARRARAATSTPPTRSA